MRILLIRHGQSANNVLAESQGHDYAAYMAGRNPEPPLSEIGHRQAQLLADALDHAPESCTSAALIPAGAPHFEVSQDQVPVLIVSLPSHEVEVNGVVSGWKA